MAALTSDEKSAISSSSTFINRIAQVLRDKGLYWKESTTPNRADVNKQTQKRKRLSKLILSGVYVNQYQQPIGDYWLTGYNTSTPVLDGNGIPTAVAIGNDFDPTYDYWAGVDANDSTDTEIEW